MTLSDREYFALAVLVYGLSVVYSVFLWRKGFRKDNWVNYGLLLGAMVFNTVAILKRGLLDGRCPVTNLYEATSFIAWTIVTAYVVFGLWSRLRFLGAFASPFLFAIGVFALMKPLDGHGPKPEFTGGLISLHATLILLAYGAFGLSSVAALMYLTQEHNLKFHKLQAIFSLLPPIQRLEVVTSQLVMSGFFLLTIGLSLSPFLLRRVPGVVVRSDPKVLWSAFVWLLYLMLVIMHWRSASGGRKFAWSTIGGFAFVLLTFWGFNLLSGIHNPNP